MPPAVPEAPQMRRAPPLVGPQRDGNLRYLCAKLCRLDNKFGCELHSRAAQVHAVVNGARKAAHSAMAVADARVKKKIEHRREPGISDVLVVPGHGAGLDLAAKAVAHNHVESLAPHFDEPRQFGKIIAVV